MIDRHIERLRYMAKKANLDIGQQVLRKPGVDIPPPPVFKPEKPKVAPVKGFSPKKNKTGKTNPAFKHEMKDNSPYNTR